MSRKQANVHFYASYCGKSHHVMIRTFYCWKSGYRTKIIFLHLWCKGEKTVEKMAKMEFLDCQEAEKSINKSRKKRASLDHDYPECWLIPKWKRYLINFLGTSMDEKLASITKLAALSNVWIILVSMPNLSIKMIENVIYKEYIPP